jgi:hypothetical protein
MDHGLLSLEEFWAWFISDNGRYTHDKHSTDHVQTDVGRWITDQVVKIPRRGSDGTTWVDAWKAIKGSETIPWDTLAHVQSQLLLCRVPPTHGGSSQWFIKWHRGVLSILKNDKGARLSHFYMIVQEIIAKYTVYKNKDEMYMILYLLWNL